MCVILQSTEVSPTYTHDYYSRRTLKQRLTAPHGVDTSDQFDLKTRPQIGSTFLSLTLSLSPLLSLSGNSSPNKKKWAHGSTATRWISSGPPLFVGFGKGCHPAKIHWRHSSPYNQ